MKSESERERRLEALRREARDQGAVAGVGVRAVGAPLPAPAGYYGLPVLKAPVWTWEVPLYFFVGGAAGGAAMLAAAYDTFSRERTLARQARLVALAGAALSPALLIADLGVPTRFLNMLRVFKPQSPMSMGSWILAAFGAGAAASVALHEAADCLERKIGTEPNFQEKLGSVPIFRIVAQAAALKTAVAGSMLATYTGVLLGATAIPVWASHRRLLPVHFGTAGLGSAAALLELLGSEDDGLHALGLGVAAVETGLGAAAEIARTRVHRPLHLGTSSWILRGGVVLSGPLALTLRLLGHRKAAAASFAAGALLSRYGWLLAGRDSARDNKAVFESQRER